MILSYGKESDILGMKEEEKRFFSSVSKSFGLLDYKTLSLTDENINRNEYPEIEFLNKEKNKTITLLSDLKQKVESCSQLLLVVNSHGNCSYGKKKWYLPINNYGSGDVLAKDVIDTLKSDQRKLAVVDLSCGANLSEEFSGEEYKDICFFEAGKKGSLSFSDYMLNFTSALINLVLNKLKDPKNDFKYNLYELFKLYHAERGAGTLSDIVKKSRAIQERMKETDECRESVRLEVLKWTAEIGEILDDLPGFLDKEQGEKVIEVLDKIEKEFASLGLDKTDYSACESFEL